jgi:tryptophan-rich sensory protein
MNLWTQRILAYLISGIAVTITALIPSSTMKETKSVWYQCIKPEITPPSIVFPIVWGILYFMIAIAFAQTMLLPASVTKTAMIIVFVVNLAFNIIWTYAYFGWHLISGSLGIIVLLWISIIYLIFGACKVNSRIITILLIPYLLWVSFATFLNALSIPRAEACSRYTSN